MGFVACWCLLFLVHDASALWFQIAPKQACSPLYPFVTCHVSGIPGAPTLAPFSRTIRKWRSDVCSFVSTKLVSTTDVATTVAFLHYDSDGYVSDDDHDLITKGQTTMPSNGEDGESCNRSEDNTSSVREACEKKHSRSSSGAAWLRYHFHCCIAFASRRGSRWLLV